MVVNKVVDRLDRQTYKQTAWPFLTFFFLLGPLFPLLFLMLFRSVFLSIFFRFPFHFLSISIRSPFKLDGMDGGRSPNYISSSSKSSLSFFLDKWSEGNTTERAEWTGRIAFSPTINKIQWNACRRKKKRKKERKKEANLLLPSFSFELFNSPTVSLSLK